MTLKINKLINDKNPLKEKEEEVDIDELNDIVDELIVKVEGLKKKVKDLKLTAEERDNETEEVVAEEPIPEPVSE
jgi:uncharacterized coiled-coil protein SlyX